MTNTEQTILDAAEKLFLDKGYSGARTIEIAKEAGVNHAMLHYYFRTKENLFNKIFEQKAEMLIGSLIHAFETNLPFEERIQLGIERHFEFLRENPNLPLFILRQIVTDEARKKSFLKKILPFGIKMSKRISTTLEEEIKQKNIQPVSAIDLLVNIASLNVFSFVAAQAFFDSDDENTRKELDIFLENRKKNNVEIILNSFKNQSK